MIKENINNRSSVPVVDSLFLSDSEFSFRQQCFHRAVYSSKPFVFDEVMTPFWRPEPDHVAHDHCLLYALGKWHLFVLSRPLAWHQALTDAVRKKDWDIAVQYPYAVGDLHLVGDELLNLSVVGEVPATIHNEASCIAQTNSYVHPVGDRFAMMSCIGGPMGQKLGLSWSKDLMDWAADSASPVWMPPVWAGRTEVCKGPCIVEYDDRFYIYYNLNLDEGTSSVSLISTTDFLTFEDHGPVLKFPFHYRGTQGCESPCVFHRNGIWHLMVASGDYWWHTISNRPDRFMSTQGISSATVGAVYDMGPFHVGKVVQHGGRWWMTSSYKAEWRRICRQRGTEIFRGENEDERGLCEGLFISEIIWDGDKPVLHKPQSLAV